MSNNKTIEEQFATIIAETISKMESVECTADLLLEGLGDLSDAALLSKVATLQAVSDMGAEVEEKRTPAEREEQIRNSFHLNKIPNAPPIATQGEWSLQYKPTKIRKFLGS